MLYSGTDPESYITEYTLVYEDNIAILRRDYAAAGSEHARGRRVCPRLAPSRRIPPRSKLQVRFRF